MRSMAGMKGYVSSKVSLLSIAKQSCDLCLLQFAAFPPKLKPYLGFARFQGPEGPLLPLGTGICKITLSGHPVATAIRADRTCLFDGKSAAMLVKLPGHCPILQQKAIPGL